MIATAEIVSSNLVQWAWFSKKSTAQLFYGDLDFIRDNLGEPVPKETITHLHLSWSSIIPSSSICYNPWHLPVQFTSLVVFSTICLQVFFGLRLGLAPSTSYSIHFFTQSLSCLCSTCHTIATSFAVVPRLCHLILVSLSTLYLEL